MTCDVLVICQVKRTGMFAQAFIVGIDGAHEEAQGLGCISGAPFLSGLFLLDTNWDILVSYTATYDLKLTR